MTITTTFGDSRITQERTEPRLLRRFVNGFTALGMHPARIFRVKGQVFLLFVGDDEWEPIDPITVHVQA